MDKLLFVINPIAGGGGTEKLIPAMRDMMDNIGIEYDIVLTKGPKDAINISKSGIEKGYTTIVAVGGDGTINEVALGILESGKGLLGIIPSGTGNDLARTLEIPFSLKEAIDTIINANKKDIDIGIVNNKLFLNIASIGFDAEVVKNAEKFKKKVKSKIAYIIGILDTLITFKDKKIIIEIDDVPVEKSISLVAIGNGKYYGGGLRVLPMAMIEDGYFHICIVNKISKIKLLFLFPSIFKGNHIRFKKYVEVFKAKKIRIITKDEAYLNVDGEIYDIEEETLFSIDSRKLTVLC